MSDPSEIRNKPKLDVLFEENIQKFNELVALGQAPDLRNANLASLDLRKAKLKGLDLSGSYLRGANLRGVDLTGCNLYGASMQGAYISGALFPDNVPVDELRLSVEYGTRIRIYEVDRKVEMLVKLLSELFEHLQKESGKSE